MGNYSATIMWTETPTFSLPSPLSISPNWVHPSTSLIGEARKCPYWKYNQLESYSIDSMSMGLGNVRYTINFMGPALQFPLVCDLLDKWVTVYYTFAQVSNIDFNVGYIDLTTMIAYDYIDDYLLCHYSITNLSTGISFGKTTASSSYVIRLAIYKTV